MQNSTNFVDTYLIIGAGPVGLAMAKSLKAAGIKYEQVDAADDLGGNWYHGTYPSAHILSSTKAMEYPDFPMPDSYPDFPSSAQMLDYYRNYAEHYDLSDSIQFNTKVSKVRPTKNNLWKVKFKDGRTITYRAVLVCNGHHWSKRFPEYPGTFTGETFHSKEYYNSDQVKDKRVLVIGAGNSAFDIVSECARSSKESYLSVRRGIWIFPKTFMGRPLSALQVPKMPEWLQERLTRLMLKVTVGSHKEYGLPKPEGKVFGRHPTVNTETLMHVKHGRITIKGAVERLDGSSVVFEDGSKEEVDTIVYCTGFHTSFPFLPEELDRVDGNTVKVYGYSMYDDYKGLYLIGWMQPRGGVGSLIAPYADMLTEFIKIQERIETPIGNVLKEMGEELPGTHLFGGGMVLKWIAKMHKKMKRIEKTGQKMDQKATKPATNEVIEEEQVPLREVVNPVMADSAKAV